MAMKTGSALLVGTLLGVVMVAVVLGGEAECLRNDGEVVLGAVLADFGFELAVELLHRVRRRRGG